MFCGSITGRLPRQVLFCLNVAIRPSLGCPKLFDLRYTYYQN